MDRLLRDVISEIMVRLLPKDVLSLRYTCVRLYKMDHFKRLLEAHYPNSLPTSNPMKQYIAITLGVRTYYKIPDALECEQASEVGSPVRISRSFRSILSEEKYAYSYHECYKEIPESMFIDTVQSDDLVFSLPGVAIPEGASIWFAQMTDHWGYEIVVKNTKEELAEYVSLNCRDYLDDIVESFKGDAQDEQYDRFSSLEISAVPEFDEWLLEGENKKYHELVPFTEENIFKFVMKYDNFQPFDGDEHNNWIFYKRSVFGIERQSSVEQNE